jgi:hypothetical protein
MTADDLRNAQNEFAASEDETRELRLARNTAIQTALQAGWTHAQISQATGLTRGRIGQLAQRLSQNGTS